MSECDTETQARSFPVAFSAASAGSTLAAGDTSQDEKPCRGTNLNNQIDPWEGRNYSKQNCFTLD